jgi:hypothetical protein
VRTVCSVSRASPLCLAAGLLILTGCPNSSSGDAGGPPNDSGAPDGGGSPDGGGTPDAGGLTLPLPVLASTLVDHTFNVAEHMRASREMQVSGEPFAQILGYNLNGFNRQSTVTDLYTDPATGITTTDPLAYALAIESYEYSKQPMNQLSFESGAGLSLMYGPVLNPNKLNGDAGYTLLANRFQQFATESFSGGSAGNNLIVSPAPTANPLNFYGWPGWWPVMAEFASFDPTIQPQAGATNTCTFKGAVGSFGYGGGNHGSALIANYECDYNTLNLPNRSTQVSMTVAPDAMGYVAWKQGLWTINYWQTLQDTAGNGITVVNPSDVPMIGQPGNTVVGQYPDPTDPLGIRTISGAPGVYLGDIPMEGWQGLTMIDEMDNKSALLLASLLSSDGSTLTSSTISNADNYSYNSPFLYFPSLISVTETPTTTDPTMVNKYFPQPTAFAVANGDSHLSGLSGLIGGFGEAFALTDPNNSQVGGSVSFQATFDGDPFAHDDGQPDGENTMHDRVLGVMKIALVDLDRIHFDPTHSVLVDTASITGGNVTRGTKVTTHELGEAIVALRNAYRALDGSLQLYSNDTPDTLNVPGALDNAPLPNAPYTGTLQAHIITVLTAEADFLSNKLIDANGAVSNGYDLSANAVDSSPTDIAAEGAAIRGLLDAYLATSNTAYRTKAIQVFADLQKRFWMFDAQTFRTTVGQDNLMQWTPPRHAMLQGAMRQYYKLVASTPGHEAEAALLIQQIKRMNKLVLNGWNDRNQDNIVQYPSECIGPDGGVAISGMEFGERALTGELGNPGDNGDRDHDCVREITYSGFPASLAAELDISRQ